MQAPDSMMQAGSSTGGEASHVLQSTILAQPPPPPARAFATIRPGPGADVDEDAEALAAVPSKKISEQEVDTYKEQDRFLPIANVGRIMKKCLPATTKVSKDTKECVQECTSEFISFITSEAAERCLHEKRKTINGEDILFAMTTLGFENYSDTLKIYLAKFREHQRTSGRRASKKAKLSHDTPTADTEAHPLGGDEEGDEEDAYSENDLYDGLENDPIGGEEDPNHYFVNVPYAEGDDAQEAPNMSEEGPGWVLGMDDAQYGDEGAQEG